MLRQDGTLRATGVVSFLVINSAAGHQPAFNSSLAVPASARLIVVSECPELWLRLTDPAAPATVLGCLAGFLEGQLYAVSAVYRSHAAKQFRDWNND